MDIYDTRYYSLNRKLLSLVGHWPYENSGSKFRRRTIVCIVIISITVVQLMKLVTAERTFNLVAEIFCGQMLVAMCLLKHCNYWANGDKIKSLLENLKANWILLKDNDLEEMIGENTESGRKYILFCIMYQCGGVLFAVAIPFSAPILDIIAPMNESHPKVLPIPAEYLLIDQEKYFYMTATHLFVVIVTMIMTVSATDTMYLAFVFHACALFKIASYLFRHAFDNCYETTCTSIQSSKIGKNIETAVDLHNSALRYTEEINSTYHVFQFMVLCIALINISFTLFCTVQSLEHGMEAITFFVFAIFQISEMFILCYPSQKIIDESSAISFNAYCSSWYVAPFRSQALLIPVMQKATIPTHIVFGHLIGISTENCAAIVQTSISYFTALLSFGI